MVQCKESHGFGALHTTLGLIFHVCIFKNVMVKAKLSSNNKGQDIFLSTSLSRPRKNILLTWITVGIWNVWEGKKKKVFLTFYVRICVKYRLKDLCRFTVLLVPFFIFQRRNEASGAEIFWSRCHPSLNFFCARDIFFVFTELQFLWCVTLILSQNHHICKICSAWGTIICPQMSRLSNTSLIAGFTFLMVISVFAVFSILGTLIGEKEIKKINKKIIKKKTWICLKPNMVICSCLWKCASNQLKK